MQMIEVLVVCILTSQFKEMYAKQREAGKNWTKVMKNGKKSNNW